MDFLCQLRCRFVLQFIGLKYTSAASAVTMVGLEPLLVVFVGHFFFNDKAKLYHWICCAVAFAGVGMMVMGGAEEGGTIDWFGCLLILLAGLGFAGVIRPSQQMIARIGVPAFTSASMTAAAVLCLPFSLVLAESYGSPLVVGRYAVDFVYGDRLQLACLSVVEQRHEQSPCQRLRPADFA